MQLCNMSQCPIPYVRCSSLIASKRLSSVPFDSSDQFGFSTSVRQWPTGIATSWPISLLPTFCNSKNPAYSCPDPASRIPVLFSGPGKQGSLFGFERIDIFKRNEPSFLFPPRLSCEVRLWSLDERNESPRIASCTASRALHLWLLRASLCAAGGACFPREASFSVWKSCTRRWLC